MLRTGSIVAWLLVTSLLFSGCDDSSPASGPADLRTVAEWAALLPEQEDFDWSDQPIRFSPPPTDWERQREQSGGLFGARFVKYEAGGQAIEVAEFKSVGDRDRCAELSDLHREIEELDAREFARRLQRARPYLGPTAINASERKGFETANRRLDKARDAFRSGKLDESREHISSALWDLNWVRYELPDVIERALFTGKGWGGIGKIELTEPVDTMVAGRPAVILDYTLAPRERPGLLQGRKVYVEHNNRLFVASFQGIEAYLPLFEAMVASVSFPTGSCEH